MKKKKGFTLVELLVVIAILAVLATVSVVGYMGFTKKAHESNDASLTAQMNTALQANGVVKKNKTLTEAREDLLEAGIDLEKVTPTTDGYSYVWDSKQDLMFLLNENREVVAPTNATISANTVDSFVVVHNETEFNTWKSNYSLYFANGYESQTLTLTKLVGIDAGTSGINDISVKDDSSTADVTMYTTSGTLTIDAEHATVRHYGEVKTVSIKAIAGESYHEYGTVTGNVEVTKGRVELESTADVNTVLVSSATSGDSKVDYNSGAKVGTVAPTTDAAKADVSSSTIPSESKQETIVDTTETSKFAGGLGTEKSPYLIETEEQFSNINTLYSQKTDEGVAYTGVTYHFKQANDIEFSKLVIIHTFTGTYDGGGHSISFGDNVNYKSAYLFNIVFNKTTIKNINYNLKKHQAISLVFQNDWKIDAVDLTFENIVIDSNGETIVANANNFGLFSQYTIANILGVKFVNCTNKANVNNSGTSTGAFLGSGWFFEDGAKEKVEYINCKNTGNITGTYYTGVLYGNGAYVGYYQGNDKTSNEYLMNNFVLNNVENTGTISSTLSNGKAGIAPNSELFNDKVKNSGSFLIGGCFDGKKTFVNLTNPNDFKLSIDSSSVGITYKVAFNINIIVNADGKTQSNTTKYFYDATLDNTITNTSISNKYIAVSEEIAASKYGIDTSKLSFGNDGIAIEIKDNTTILVFNDSSLNGKTIGKDSCGESSVSVLLYAYDNEGLCIGVRNIK